MNESAVFQHRFTFQIAYAFGEWKPMCELLIVEEEGEERAIERFFIWKEGGITRVPMSNAIGALSECTSRNFESRRRNPPPNRRYDLQIAPGRGGFKPFLEVVIEYDDDGREKEHRHTFRVMSPDGQTIPAQSYSDALAKCSERAKKTLDRTADGMVRPPAEDHIDEARPIKRRP
jgi:hypothetical protein